MNKQTVGGIVLTVGGILDEAILQGQNVSFVKELIGRFPVVFNQATALSVMGVGVITLWVSWKRRAGAETPSTAGGISQQSTSSVQNSGNVTQKTGDLNLAVHVGYPPPQPAPQPQVSRPAPAPKNEPNLQFSGRKEAVICFDSSKGKWGEPGPYDVHHHKAILLKVDNSPKRDAIVRPAERLSAHLRFIRDKDDDLTISPVCWYDNPFGAIDMAVPSHEWLIIGAKEFGDKSFVPVALGNRRLVSGHSTKDFFNMHIPERGIVEVQLLEHGSVLGVRPRFEC